MILLTGATGYIGSHAWLGFLESGYQVIGIDNFSNSDCSVLERIKEISHSSPIFLEGDLLDQKFVEGVFKNNVIDAVVHFAALKSVGDSVVHPLKYYRNNIQGLFNLTDQMIKHNCKNFVFSSSATVYDSKNIAPYTETMSLEPSNPYGWTKLMGEKILRDIEISDPTWKVAYLRYFNPVGAHNTGLIGELPKGVPNNLMPYVSQVAAGIRNTLFVYGADWSTPDGTGVRDYIHVIDLVKGHIKALDYLLSTNSSLTVNLGTGRGSSVMEVIKTYERVSGKKVPFEIVARRPGDVASCYADVTLARNLLGWQAEYDLEKMCTDSWRFQLMNINM